MRYYIFVALVGIALTLDLALLGLSLAGPKAWRRHSARPAAMAMPQRTREPTAPTVFASPTATLLTSPTPPPAATDTPRPTSFPTPTSAPTATATPTPIPQLVASNTVAFTPRDRTVRANIRLALSHYDGALTHVVIPPGERFSFNAALGVDPERLPWKEVVMEPPPAAPAEEPPPDATASPMPTPARKRIRGGGLCDLASRYVMAARPLLPDNAFRFVNHVRSTGIRLEGVPVRDSVSIWAVGGRKGEQDLVITNPTKYWLEFVVEREGETITVHAQLWDGIPPDW